MWSYQAVSVWNQEPCVRYRDSGWILWLSGNHERPRWWSWCRIHLRGTFRHQRASGQWTPGGWWTVFWSRMCTRASSQSHQERTELNNFIFMWCDYNKKTQRRKMTVWQSCTRSLLSTVAIMYLFSMFSLNRIFNPLTPSDYVILHSVLLINCCDLYYPISFFKLSLVSGWCHSFDCKNQRRSQKRPHLVVRIEVNWCMISDNEYILIQLL